MFLRYSKPKCAQDFWNALYLVIHKHVDLHKYSLQLFCCIAKGFHLKKLALKLNALQFEHFRAVTVKIPQRKKTQKKNHHKRKYFDKSERFSAVFENESP